MNDLDLTLLGKQIADLQSGMRKARAEVASLNLRFNILETRLAAIEQQFGEAIAEVGFKVDDLKGYIDIRMGALEALLHEALAR